jgi:hypothetical protein
MADRDLNHDQVSIVRIPAHMGSLAEDCEGCPDKETCPEYVYSISIGGVVIAEAFSAGGVVNFLRDYIPGLVEGIQEAEAAVETAKVLLGKIQTLLPEMEQQALKEQQEPQGPPPEFN